MINTSTIMDKDTEAGKKTIVLAAPIWNKGHYETQMQLFLSILLPKNCRVIALCAEPEKVEKWVEEYMPDFKADLFTARFTLMGLRGRVRLKTGWAWSYISASIDKAASASGWEIDMVFFNNLDSMIYNTWRGVFFPRKINYPWAGLYLTPIFKRQPEGFDYYKKHISLKVFKGIKNCQGITIYDEGSFNECQDFFDDRKIYVLPDVTDETMPSPLPLKFSAVKAKAGDKTIIGLVGLLQKRKGLLNFLRAAKAMDPEKCFFLLAGYLHWPEYTKHEQMEIKELLEILPETSFHFESGYMDDPAEVNAWIDLCDIVCLCYEKFYYSSGIMTKAAAREKLMLVTRGYCMGERVQRYGLGLTAREGDLEEIIAGLKIMTDNDRRKKMLAQAQFKKFMDFHNYCKLDEVLSGILEV